MDNRFDAVNEFDRGKIVKMEVDYSSTCDEKIPLCKEMAKNEAKFHEAIDILLQLEKQTRLGADMISCSRVLVAICQICFEAGNWNALNEYISLLVKRRSQLKQSVVKMIQECATYVDKTPDKDTKLKLINTLRTVTEGKIYVEVERARLTQILAGIKEADGDISGAASIMEELQVETYGSMAKREKVQLILEQMRLCLAKQDFVRTQIIAKKISTKFFDDPEQQDLKFKYYGLMIRLDQDSSFIRTSRHYQAVVDSEVISNTPEKRQKMMTFAVLYCILSPYDNEQQDMMHNLSKKKLLEEIPIYKELLRLFMCKELINFKAVSNVYGQELLSFEIFNQETAHGKKCWAELKNRLIEHNIRIISNYYTRINLRRMSELLELPDNETEDYLSRLVNSGTLTVKIDRPSGVIHFAAKKAPSDVLNDWASGINELMSLVNKTCHLINKEECINNVMSP
ncbi:26S proteasome non-ATPase regulatory subunit 12 [Phlebotomus papatasi]|uniref:26S proteasome non-ATPase regulatory subunit 12 n=1 Tax=Phlebotomus papatasi TaxID=29031 RepID=UPI00248411B5|nr:26S proteasome non-ATPase regulatory subunit 12 [Phlebotomus papatasi]